MDLPTDDGFVAFYRAYARTGVHAATTAALTAFGTLTIVHRGFAAVALAAYGLPPLALYARGAWFGADERAGDSAAGPPDDGDTTAGEATNTAGAPAGWSTARTPAGGDLHGVAVAGDGAVAVGESGVVLERPEVGAEWERSLPDGPGTTGATLHGVDATSDGAAVWVAGDGGAVGRRDANGRWVDHSAPGSDTNNLAGVAVAGPAGDETVLLVDGGGGVRRGRYRAGELAWADTTTPGSGSSIAGVALRDDGTGYVVDTAGAAFRTTDGGQSFTAMGLETEGTPTAVAATDDGPAVATTAGVVLMHDGSRWTPERVVDGELVALAAGVGGATVKAGAAALAASHGAVHERDGPGDWRRVAVPTAGRLQGVALGASHGVAVGTGGTVLERRDDAPD
jgi:hypothetical protein